MSFKHASVVLASGLAIACSVTETNTRDRAIGPDLPSGTMVRIAEERAAPGIPYEDPIRVAVGHAGQVAILLRDEPKIAMYDSSLALIGRVGRRGEGPGELTHAVSRMTFLGDTLFVATGPRIVMFPGQPVLQAETWRTMVGHLFVTASPGALDFWRPNPNDGFPLVRMSLNGTDQAVLLSTTDSFYRRIVTGPSGRQDPKWPIVASNDSLLVIGDGYSYRLMQLTLSSNERMYFGRELPPRVRTERELEEARALFGDAAGGIRGPNGQLLPTAALRERLARLPTETLPRFSPGDLHVVGNAVLVVTQESDSVFVEEFHDGKYLGRVRLNCLSPGSASVSWPWLALLCDAENGDQQVLRVVRRFKMEWSQDANQQIVDSASTR